MKRQKKHIILGLATLFLFSVTGCGKKDVETPTDYFGEIEESSEIETTQDEFAVSDQNIAGYEIRETTRAYHEMSPEEIESSASAKADEAEALAESYAQEKAKALGQEYAPMESTQEEIIASGTGQSTMLVDLGDGLVLSMKEQIWSGLIDEEGMSKLDSFIDEYFPDESEDSKQAIKKYVEKEWEDYSKIQESLAALPPEETFSEEELQEHPEFRNYSKPEVDYALSLSGKSLEDVDKPNEFFEHFHE